MSKNRRVASVLSSVACSGLIVGCLALPVAADDLAGGGNVSVTAGVEGDCVLVGAGTGSGTTEASVCREDLEGPARELMTAVLEQIDGAVPGDPAGLLPEGFGLDPEIIERLARILPGLVGTDRPGGGPYPDSSPTVTPASGPSLPADAVGDAQDARNAPQDETFGADSESPAAAGADTAVVPGVATLPRTGGGAGTLVLRMFAVAAAGRALFRWAGRRVPAVLRPGGS